VADSLSCRQSCPDGDQHYPQRSHRVHNNPSALPVQCPNSPLRRQKRQTRTAWVRVSGTY
jgi:hypothetical protein